MKIDKHKLITLVPFVMLFLSLMSGIFSSTDWYRVIAPYLGDTVGFSMLTNLVFMFIYFRRSFCDETKIAVSGLMVMSVLGLVLKLTGLPYNYTYDMVICSIVSTLCLIMLYKRWY